MIWIRLCLSWWKCCRMTRPECFSLTRAVQTPATKENAPLPRRVVSHPGRQLKCKWKMLIRTVSTSILMHKMGILYGVQRKMHCSLGKTLPPLFALEWAERAAIFIFFLWKPAGKKKIKENGLLRSDPDVKCWHKSTKSQRSGCWFKEVRIKPCEITYTERRWERVSTPQWNICVRTHFAIFLLSFF